MKLENYDDYLGEEIKNLKHDKHHPKDHPTEDISVIVFLGLIMIVLWAISDRI